MKSNFNIKGIAFFKFSDFVNSHAILKHEMDRKGPNGSQLEFHINNSN